MKVRFKCIEYIYDVDSDKCCVTHPQGTESFENPIEAFNVFISDLSFMMGSQLKTELEKKRTQQVDRREVIK